MEECELDHILTDKDELERVQSMVDIFNQTRKKEPWGFLDICMFIRTLSQCFSQTETAMLALQFFGKTVSSKREGIELLVRAPIELYIFDKRVNVRINETMYSDLHYPVSMNLPLTPASQPLSVSVSPSSFSSSSGSSVSASETTSQTTDSILTTTRLRLQRDFL